MAKAATRSTARSCPRLESLHLGGLPLGLAHKVRLLNAVGAGKPVRWEDVYIDERQPAVAFRREMEQAFR